MEVETQRNFNWVWKTLSSGRFLNEFKPLCEWLLLAIVAEEEREWSFMCFEIVFMLFKYDTNLYLLIILLSYFLLIAKIGCSKTSTIMIVYCHNKSIFEENFQSSINPTFVIQNYNNGIKESMIDPFFVERQRKDTIYVRWKHPRHGWLKLNIDGPCKGNWEIGECGGLFCYNIWVIYHFFFFFILVF